PQPPQVGAREESVCGEADDPISKRGDSLRLPPASYFSLLDPCSSYHSHKVDGLLVSKDWPVPLVLKDSQRSFCSHRAVRTEEGTPSTCSLVVWKWQGARPSARNDQHWTRSTRKGGER